MPVAFFKLKKKNLMAQLRDNRNKPGLPVCNYTKLNLRKQYTTTTLLGNLSSLPRISRGKKNKACVSSYLSIYCNIAKDSEVQKTTEVDGNTYLFSWSTF